MLEKRIVQQKCGYRNTNVGVVVEAESNSEEALFAFASAYTNPSLSDSTTTSLSVIPKEKKIH